MAPSVVAVGATDPFAAGGLLAYQLMGGAGVVDRGAGPQPLAGTHPTLNPTRLTVREPDALRVVDVTTGTGEQLLHPCRLAGRLAYVHASFERQRLRIGPAAPATGHGDRTLLEIPPTARRDAGHEPGRERRHEGYPGDHPPPLPPRPARGVTHTLWTTALTGTSACVARVEQQPDGTATAALPRVDR